MQQQSIPSRYSWRTVDIVTASIIAVAAGVIYWAYGLVWGVVGDPIGALLPGLSAFPATLWLFGEVLGGLVVRKPGAAVYVALVAGLVEMVLGGQWGLLTLEASLVQGLGVEIIFAILLYRVWNVGVAVLAGIAAGFAMAINDLIVSYPGSDTLFATVYVVSALVGGAVLAGLLPWWMLKGLARAGALQRFAAGRQFAAE